MRCCCKYGLDENTIFIFTSEQGYSFQFGKWTCYDEGLHTVRHPLARDGEARKGHGRHVRICRCDPDAGGHRRTERSPKDSTAGVFCPSSEGETDSF